MKKHVLNILAVVLAIGLTAFSIRGASKSKQKALEFIKLNFGREVNTVSWVAFSYIGGPHNSPYSYVKVFDFGSINNYCPGTGQFCAIFAEEDLFNNPGHPSQASLNFLLSCYGFSNYFFYEVAGLIEFKFAWEFE